MLIWLFCPLFLLCCFLPPFAPGRGGRRGKRGGAWIQCPIFPSLCWGRIEGVEGDGKLEEGEENSLARTVLVLGVGRGRGSGELEAPWPDSWVLGLTGGGLLRAGGEEGARGMEDFLGSGSVLEVCGATRLPERAGLVLGVLNILVFCLKDEFINLVPCVDFAWVLCCESWSGDIGEVVPCKVEGLGRDSLPFSFTGKLLVLSFCLVLIVVLVLDVAKLVLGKGLVVLVSCVRRP